MMKSTKLMGKKIEVRSGVLYGGPYFQIHLGDTQEVGIPCIVWWHSIDLKHAGRLVRPTRPGRIEVELEG